MLNEGKFFPKNFWDQRLKLYSMYIESQRETWESRFGAFGYKTWQSEQCVDRLHCLPLRKPCKQIGKSIQY